MDFLEELNAELASVLDKEKRKAEAEKLRRKSKDFRQTTEGRAVAHAKASVLEAEIEAERWQIIATGALFHHQHCTGCDSDHQVFVQFMEHHQLISKPTTMKWVRALALRPALPRETLVQSTTTPICPNCALDHGFCLEDPDKIERTVAGIGPSASYQPTDPNSEFEEEAA